MNNIFEQISEEVWDVKYRYRYQGKIIDNSLEDTWNRVAKAISNAEKSTEQKEYEQKFYNILEDFKFLPGGRILAGAGTKHKVTLFNCYVMKIASDSLTGIFNALKEGALTLQEGGGVGYDFSILRPRNQVLKHSGGIASGPVSFMNVWDSMSATMVSTGFRRGAMMGVLRCDHPDIEEFITAKLDPKLLRHFNVSVLVTDAFMKAVYEDKDWDLVFPIRDDKSMKNRNIVHRNFSSRDVEACEVMGKVHARALWEKIIHSAYDTAEPGVLFEDTINRLNPLWYREWISATNPCGEIPLPYYGACNLGSINLTRFVINPFQDNAKLDWQGIENTVMMATRFLDNVCDISNYPLKAQKKEAQMTRRIGLGLTGLADVLIMLGIRYGSQASIDFAKELMQRIAYATWHASIELGKEKGSFAVLEKDKYLNGEFVLSLPEDIRLGIKAYGLRNSHHNTIAPTGSISLLASNVSSGIEPIYSPSYQRKVRLNISETKEFTVSNYSLRLWKSLNNDNSNNGKNSLPPAWVDSQSLTPEEHLFMQATMQPYIDNAISKTINLPDDFPFDKVAGLYSKAHKMGLKGCTLFRTNPITGNILKLEGDVVDPCCKL